MARIPQDEIEQLKQAISLERLVCARGIELQRHGADLVGLCPFHNDKTPSLVITPGKNLWNCLGACGEGGDVIKWVMRSERVSFRHAIELLKKDAPLNGARAAVRSRMRKLPSPIAPGLDDQRMLLRVVAFYNETLKHAPEAQKYLEKRGLMSAEIMERFQLGFANRTLGYHLPSRDSVIGMQERERLQQLGILRQDTGHEHFNGSVVIPILTLEGQVAQMYGRKITSNLRQGTPDHLYLPGDHGAVWNEEALIPAKEIILCEALIDALTFWCAGYRNVTASYGVNGFTERHKAAFQKHGTKRIYIAYDRDDAGETAARKHAGDLMSMGIECFRVLFPKNMDANEYALKVQPAPKSLGVMLNKAEWLGKGKRPSIAVIEPTPAAPRVEIKPEPQIEEPPPMISEEQIPPEIIEPPIPTPEPAIIEEQPEIAAEEKISEEPLLPLAAEPEEMERAEATMPIPLPSAAAPKIDVPIEIRGEEIVLTQGERRYRVLGMAKNTAPGVMKINLMASATNLRGDFGYHVDTLDLYAARQRTAFVTQACEELGIKDEIIRRDLGRVLLKLEEMQHEQIEKALEKPNDEPQMSAAERAEALELLRDPNLLNRILDDFERCGVIGEEMNKQIGYLAVVSRLLDTPLAIIVQSSSAAGKSSLMDAVLAFMPEEQRVQYSAMTGQSLFYMGETDLKNKILAIVEEEGAQRAAYALKLLQSEGALTIASTGKHPETGRLVTHQYRVEGPVMIFLTTTAIDIDEELLNRCIILSVNEDAEQTRAIHRMQREAQTLAGLLRKKDREEVLRIHRNAQRLLKPLMVVNEHARDLTFPDGMTRTRRDHMKYLTLIRAITLLHQHQRPTKTTEHRGKTVEYIEATEQDVALAKRLINDVLVRSLDELQPQARRLFLLIDDMVKRACEEQQIARSEYRFSRRDVRAYTRWSDSQLKRHLARLEELEYLIVHRGGRGQTFVYELYVTAQGEESQPVLSGLMADYDTKKSGSEGEKYGPSLAQVRGMSGDGAGEGSPVNTRVESAFYENGAKHTIREHEETPAVVVPPAMMKKANGAARAAGVK